MGIVLVGAAGAQTVTITGSSDAILGIDADLGGAYLQAELPACLIDGTTSTKYLNYSGAGAGIIVTPGASVVRSLVLSTANDFVARDPASYALYGTNSPVTSPDNSAGTAESWTLLASGVLTLPTGRNTIGSPVSFANATSYTSYKLVFPATKGSINVQVSELQLFTGTLGGGTGVLAPGNPIRAVQTNGGSESTANDFEPPGNLVDGSPNTKYLNFSKTNAGFIITPTAGPSVLTSFEWFTANDAAERDPASYQVYGTNDPITTPSNGLGTAENWTLLTSGALNAPTARLVSAGVTSVGSPAAYRSYKWLATSLRGPNPNSLQIGEIRFDGVLDTATESPTLHAPWANDVSGSSVGVAFTLPEAAADGTATLTFAGAVTRTLMLAGSQCTAGYHDFSFNPANPAATNAIVSVSDGTSVPDGTYTVTLSYQDVFRHPAATASAAGVTIDTVTQAPTLSAPAANAVTAGTVNVAFTLPETAADGSLLLTFAGAVTRNLTLAGAQTSAGAHSFNFAPSSPVTTGTITAIEGGATIPSGAYTVTLSYRDQAGNPAAMASAANVTVDSTTEAPTLTAPATGAVTGSPTSVVFTLPEAATSGTVTLTFAGPATRTLVLTNAQGTAGTHSFSFDTANPAAATSAVASVSQGDTLPDGVYLVTLRYQDASGNPAVAVSSAQVTIDTVAPVLSLPGNGVIAATSASGAVVKYSAGASDPGGSGLATSSFTPSSGSIFPIGATTVSASATDKAGHTVTGSFMVTVGPWSDTRLTALTLSSGTLSPAFAAVSLNYEAAVPGTVDTITVTPTAADSRATVTVNGMSVASGSPSNSIALVAGVNLINVVVTAPNTGATTTYQLRITRESAVISIESPAGTALADNASVLTLPTLPVGGSGSRTFQIRNVGHENLVLSPVAIAGTPGAGLSLTQPGATTLAPQADTTFSVNFAPTAAGTTSGTLVVASNDPAHRAFRIGVTGTGLPAPPPVAVIGGPYSVREGRTLALDASASHAADGSTEGLSYAWEFNNNAQFDDATGVAPIFTAADNGSVPVALRVTDAAGRTAIVTTTVTVTSTAPTLGLIAPPTAEAGVPVRVEVQIFDESAADRAAGFATTIDFNDGTQPATLNLAGTQTVTHTFLGTGMRTLSAAAMDKDGAPATAATARILVLSQAVPVAASPSWSAFGTAEIEQFGSTASPAGDLNGDGYADLVLKSSGYSLEKISVCYGSPRGPDTATVWTYRGVGGDVAGVGDVNGDGYDDLAAVEGDFGRTGVLVFLGSDRGLSSAPSTRLAYENGNNGIHAVAAAGDVNGDGYGDVLAATNYDTEAGQRGTRILLFPGSATGPAITPEWQFDGREEGASLVGGRALATAGDVNGDGCADILVGEPGDGTQAGRVLLFHGGRTGLPVQPTAVLTRGGAGDAFGVSAGAAGDVNGDGFQDIIVGASLAGGAGQPGGVWVYAGSAGGINATAAWSLAGSQSGAQLGSAVAGAGDVNGDGFSDVVVAAAAYDNGQTDEGMAWLYLGSAQGLRQTSSWTFETNQAPVEAPFSWSARITSVGGAADCNGDGLSDVVVGSGGYTTGSLTGAGAAWVFLGSPARAQDPLWSVAGGGGTLNSRAVAAGDLNGDGVNDVVVGSSGFSASGGLTEAGKVEVFYGTAGWWSGVPAKTLPGTAVNAHFGAAVCRLGDINNDGYDDLAVGAPGVAGTTPVAGRVAIYLGSAEGLTFWTDLAAAQAASEFGLALAAGDVDGDGWTDLLVGAPGHSGSGNVFLYTGGAAGLSTTPSWSDATFASAGGAAGQRYGAALCVLDHNNDGLADFGMGAPGTSAGQGRFDLRWGGAAASITSFLTPQSFLPNSTVRGAGAALAAGDVTGTGMDVLLWGAPGTTVNGVSGAGLVGAEISLSQSGGVVSQRSLPLTAAVNQANAGFGTAITVADFNGDGIADTAVSAPNFDWNALADAGRITMFPGNVAAVGAAAWTLNGDAASARLGTYLDSADLDGDGQTELIASLGRGGWQAGNHTGRLGVPRLPHLRIRSAEGRDAGPCSIDGTHVNPASGALLRGFAPPLHGLSLARLEWQMVAAGSSFEDATLRHGEWQSTGLGGARLEAALTQLPANARLRVRLRIAYRSPGAAVLNQTVAAAPLCRTRWYWPAGRGEARAHLRTTPATTRVIAGAAAMDQLDRSGVKLTWSDAPDESGYVIERRAQGAAGWSELGRVQANVAEFLDATAPASALEYRVRGLGDGLPYVSDIVTVDPRVATLFGGSYQIGRHAGMSASEGPGRRPSGGLVDGLGLCAVGGVNGVGAVYNLDGTLASFHDSLTGGHPVGELTRFRLTGHAWDGCYFGVCSTGGSAGLGGVFSLRLTGAGAPQLTLVASFNTALGTRPAGGLVQGTDQALYGLMQGGGANGAGTIYRLTPDGVLQLVHAFDGTTGRAPQGCLALDTVSGALYGVTLGGGGADSGTVFRWLNAQRTVLCDFGVARNGIMAMHPTTAPTLLRQGTALSVFGTLSQGPAVKGAVFRIDANNQVTYPLAFAGGNGAVPSSPLLVLPGGSQLCGITQAGGSTGGGVFFVLDATAVPGTVQNSFLPLGQATAWQPRGALQWDAATASVLGVGVSGTAADDADEVPRVFSIQPQAQLASVSTAAAAPGQTVRLTGLNLNFVGGVRLGEAVISAIVHHADGSLSFTLPTTGRLTSGQIGLVMQGSATSVFTPVQLAISKPLPDGWQTFYGMGIEEAGLDSDGDGFANLREAQFGTNPRDARSFPEPRVNLQFDGSRRIDWLSAPAVPVRVLASDDLRTWGNLGAAVPGNGGLRSQTDLLPLPRRYYRLEAQPVADSDGDGLSDFEEQALYHTNPAAPDSDGDGVPDLEEVRRRTEPNDSFDSRGPVALCLVDGDRQVLAPGTFSAAPVRVAAINGLSGGVGSFVPGAAITFAVESGDARLSAAPQTATAAGTLTVAADADGVASVFVLAGNLAGEVSLRARTATTGGQASTLASVTVAMPVAGTPRIEPASGTFARPAYVFLSAPDQLGYTTDGSLPAAPAGDVRSAAVRIAAGTVVKAQGFLAGKSPSAVVSGEFRRVSMAAGRAHFVYLDPAGVLNTWGDNTYGQLGAGGAGRAQPGLVPAFTTAALTEVAAGDDFCLALDAQQRVWAWGRNGNGQLGDNSVVNRATPALVAGATGIRQIGSGAAFCAALTFSGNMLVWGANNYGQLGKGDLVERRTATTFNLPYAIDSIALGSEHCLAVVNSAHPLAGCLYAWGRNDTGQCGDGTQTNRTQPVVVFAAGMPVAFAAANGGRSAALTAAGDLYVWGSTPSGTYAPAIATPMKIGHPGDPHIVGLGFSQGNVVVHLHTGQTRVYSWPGTSFTLPVSVVERDNAPSPLLLPLMTGEPALVSAVAECQTSRLTLGLDGSLWFRSAISPVNQTAPRLIDAQDTDGDGVPDAWEMAHFGGLTRTDGTSDRDGDGADLEEYRQGTDPGSAASKPAATTVATKEVQGHLPCQFTVNEQGAAVCSVALQTPEGPNGFGPSLGLTYNSLGNAPTPYGWGWSLQGLSVISRGPGTVFHDGAAHPVSFDGRDQFYYDGKRLVPVKGAAGGDGTEYRTLEQDFARIVSYGRLNDGPAWFRVWTSAGLIFDYHPSRSFGGQVSSWVVTHAEDRAGNFMDVRYSANVTADIDTSNDSNPVLIEWGGNRRAGTGANLTATFVYDTVTTPHYGYVNGRRCVSAQQIKAIEMRADGRLVRRYRFSLAAYVLNQLVVEAADGTSLAPLSFDYGGGELNDPTSGNQWSSVPAYTPPLPLQGDSGVQFADLDGDGLIDILVGRKAGGTSDRRAWLNTPGYIGATNWKPVAGFAPPVDFIDTAAGARGVELVDLNSDGLVDLVQCHLEASGEITSQVWINTGAGWDAAAGNAYRLPPDVHLAATLAGGTEELKRAQFCDLNADGRPDLINLTRVPQRRTTVGPIFPTPLPWSAYINQTGLTGGSHWVSGTTASYSFSRDSAGDAGQLLDFNGDGLTDIVYNADLGPARAALRNTGSGFVAAPSYTAPFEFTKRDSNGNLLVTVVVLDLNRDGLPDLWQPWAGGRTAYNTGRGWDVRAASGLLPLYTDNWQNTGQPMYDTGVRFVDLYGDGFPDQLQRLRSSTHPATDWNYGTPGGFTAKETTGIYSFGNNSPYPPLYFVSPADQGDLGVRVVDVNGDGVGDIIGCHSNPSAAGQANAAYVNSCGGLYRTLKAIHDSQGYRVDITYAGLTDATVYTKSSGAQYPVLDVTGPQRVVKQYTATNLGVRTLTQRLKYAGLRYHQLGLGSLGFASIERTDVATGITEKTTYLQEFPFVGMPSRVEVRLSNAVLTRENDTVWADLQDSSVSPALHFVYNSQTRVRAYETTGIFVSQSTGTNDYDAQGHLTHSLVTGFSTPGQEFVTETWNTYQDDEDKWFRSRLTGTVTDHQVPGQARVRRTAVFDYALDTGLIQSETIEPGFTQSQTTTRERDVFGNVIRLTTRAADSGEVREVRTQFDVRGRFPVRRINALGHVVQTAADAALEVPLWTQDANGLRTTFEYDGFGRAVRMVRPDGSETRLARLFDTATQTARQTVEDSTGQIRVLYMDTLERPVSQTQLAPDGQIVYRDITYDSIGRLAKVYRPYFLADRAAAYSTSRCTAYTYDAFNRALVETAPNGGVTTYQYSKLVTVVTDANSHTKTTTFNAIGQVVRVDDAVGGSVLYSYDSYGNLVQTNANGAITQAAYDVLGRQTGINDPGMGRWTYAYNGFGELVAQTDARGRATALQYDALGRLTTRTEVEGTTTWVYDSAPGKALGLLAAVYSPGPVRENCFYDALGRPTLVTSEIQGATYRSAATYDAQSRPLTQVQPTGFTTRNVYNSIGALVEVKNDQTGASYWKAQAFNADNLPTSELFGNGVQTTSAFDAATGALATLRSTKNAAGDVQNLAYTFDLVGNLTQRQDLRQSVSEDFEYDSLDRLTQTRRNGAVSGAFSYAGNGNLLSRSGVGSYTYGENGAGPHAVTAVSAGSQTARYGYDANGNLVSGGGRTLGYSSFNLPVTLQTGSTSVNFLYGAGRARVVQEKITDSLVERTTYLGGYEKVETRTLGASSPQIVRHVHYIGSPAGTVAVHSQTTALGSTLEATTYLHRDHLDSVDTVTGSAGEVVERLSYGAFGERRNADWTAASTAITAASLTRGFTGHEHLDSVGLVHMNGRVYDPALGRFTSADPGIDGVYSTQGYNRYSYVANNPLSYADPSGFFKVGRIVSGLVSSATSAVTSVTAKVNSLNPGAAALDAFLSTQQGQKVGKWVHENRKALITIAAAVVVGAVVTSYTGNPILGGAAAGAVGGGLGTALNGGSPKEVLKAAAIGAIVGAATAGAGGVASSISNPILSVGFQALATGVIQGGSEKAQGGSFKHGFKQGFKAGLVGGAANAVVPPASGTDTQAFMVNAGRSAAISGGTAEMNGDRWDNAAATGAFSYAVGAGASNMMRPAPPPVTAEAAIEKNDYRGLSPAEQERAKSIIGARLGGDIKTGPLLANNSGGIHTGGVQKGSVGWGEMAVGVAAFGGGLAACSTGQIWGCALAVGGGYVIYDGYQRVQAGAQQTGDQNSPTSDTANRLMEK